MADGFVAELRLDEHGRVWARHVADANGQGGGLSLYRSESANEPTGAGRWTAISPALSGNVTDFWPEGTNGVWIASFFQAEAGGAPVGGLTYIDLNTWQRFSLETLGGAAVSETWLDENDDLWLGPGDTAGWWRAVALSSPQGIQSARWTGRGLLDADCGSVGRWKGQPVGGDG
jgi:hypothetical protein